MLYLNSVADVVPDYRPTLFELADRYEMSAAELVVMHRVFGLDRVPVWQSGVEDLIESAVTRLLARSGIDPGAVRWLVYTHTGTQPVPAGDALLVRICCRLGLNSAQTFGMTTNNCASAICAMQVIERLLATGRPGDAAIVVTADVAFTVGLQSIAGTTIIGDAAVACLFAAEGPGHRVVSSHQQVHGQHSACLWQDEEHATEFEAEYVDRVATAMRATLDKAGIGWEQIRLVLPHNINQFSWKMVAARAGIPYELVYLDQVPLTAHCLGADIFLNLVQAGATGRFQDGDLLLLVTVGLGAVFAATVIEYARAAS